MAIEDINKAQAFADIRNFLVEAGAFAKARQKDAKCYYKDGNQAVTETDLAISKMAHEKLADWLAREGHILLDEESIAEAGTPAEVFASTRYQWILDPIDGTAGYAMGRRMWGVMLGLWENGRPLMGGVILPLQRALLLCDGARSWIVEEFGTSEESERELRAQPMAINSQTFVESYQANCLAWGEDVSKYRAWINTPEAAVQAFWGTLSGRAAGTTVMPMYSVWDIAAAASLARCAGFVFHEMEDGRPKEVWNAADFKDSWKLARPFLVCDRKNYADLRTLFG